MKNKQQYKVIGLMSGTSLDGLDIAYCHFQNKNNKWSFELLNATTLTYPPDLNRRLKHSTTLSGLELVLLDIELGTWIGNQVKNFVDLHHLEVELIASHGHTVFHQPEKGLTLQIGDGNLIAAITGAPVAYNFRSLDLALGGQGAPLVPIGDQLLFHEYDYCLNLGGIANISFEQSSQRLAFDIAPCNLVLNYVANTHGLDFDEDGKLARNGTVIEPLLNGLNALNFYKSNPPKSLGLEWVQKNVFPLIKEYLNSPENLMHTLTEHIAYQISQSVMRKNVPEKILITGGGTFNGFLLEKIQLHMPREIDIIIPEKEIIDFKEAIVFGFLGVLRLRGENNCLSSVTGACIDNCGGILVGQ